MHALEHIETCVENCVDNVQLSSIVHNAIQLDYPVVLYMEEFQNSIRSLFYQKHH